MDDVVANGFGDAGMNIQSERRIVSLLCKLPVDMLSEETFCIQWSVSWMLCALHAKRNHRN